MQLNNTKVPYCDVLEYPQNYGQRDVDAAKKRVIRTSMDGLMANCPSRPSEWEILDLAKSLATTYRILRDLPEGQVRDNYVCNM